MFSQRNIIITIFALISGATIFAFAVKPQSFLTTPKSQTATTSAESTIFSTSSAELATYHSKSFPISFQYPKGWIVDDTLGGIEITSSKEYVGNGIGTMPNGGFEVHLAPFKRLDNTLDVWCRKNIERDSSQGDMNFIISTSTDVFTRQSKIVAYDFRSQRDPAYNARVVCIEDNDTYIAIDGYPLTASQLPLLNIIVNSVKADHDGRKFESGN